MSLKSTKWTSLAPSSPTLVGNFVEFARQMKDSTKDADKVSDKVNSLAQMNTDAAPVKLTETWVRVPPVELDCSRRNRNSTTSPRGGVGS